MADHPKQKQSSLLVDPACVQVREDRGITWVTDRYALVRADLFRTPPKPRPHQYGFTIRSKTLRGVLAKARNTERGNLVVVGTTEDEVLITDERRVGMVNRPVWEGLTAARLTPLWAEDGAWVSWWGTVRGKRTLFAVLATKRPNPWSAYLREELVRRG